GEVRDFQSAGITRVPVIDLVLGFSPGHPHLRCVHDDDVVAGVDVRRVLRLMLAAQAHRDLGGELAEHLALSVDHEPAVLDFACLRRVGFHCWRFKKRCGLYPKKWRHSRELRRIHQRRRVEETYCIPDRLSAPECCKAMKLASVSRVPHKTLIRNMLCNNMLSGKKINKTQMVRGTNP